MKEKHISSLIVHTLPAEAGAVAEGLKQHPNLEIHAFNKHQGKIVVVLETDSTREINQAIDSFSGIRSVLSVAMIYHHIEPIHSLNEALG